MNRAWDYWAAVSPKGKEPFMRISLQLEGCLARFAPANPDAYELEPGVTVGALIARLGIRQNEVMLAFLRGRQADFETVIPDGATVLLCPCICGS